MSPRPEAAPAPPAADRLLDGLAVYLAQSRRVAITTHIRPDGDAMGSALALAHFLNHHGHQAQVLLSSPVPDYLQWMPGAEACRDAEAHRPACEQALAAAELVVCLDFGVLARLEPLEGPVRAALAAGTRSLHLDHHLELEPFATWRLRDVTASSTCELVGRLLDALEPPKAQLSAEVATCLYTGMLTDTGSFRFDSTTPAVHRRVADLIDAGAQPSRIQNLVFSNFSEARTRFLGRCLTDGLRVLPELHTAYITVPMTWQQQHALAPGDTEGIVNFALGIRGINFAVILIEYPDQVKLSFRSIGAFSAQAFAGHFEGGGHYNAAGGRARQPLAEVERRFLDLLPQYAADLAYARL